MDTDSHPTKRVRLTPPTESHTYLDTNADFVHLGSAEHEPNRAPSSAAVSTLQHDSNRYHGRPRYDTRNKDDRPKSKHALPGNDQWILVKTKLGRRFVHNPRTKQSLWRIPRELAAAVETFELEEEKKRNMAWSEEQFKLMQQQQKLEKDVAQDPERRRRSISLQREDEEAMMAELAVQAAQAEAAEEQDAREAVQIVANLEPRGYLGEASDSEYEYVEVTDTEGEEGEDDEDAEDAVAEGDAPENAVGTAEAGPVDFGEDDIAYQLAMMGEQYGLDPEEYEQDDEDEVYEEEDDTGPSEAEAIALFHQMLDNNGVSPFTPWDKLITDESTSSVVFDERYTVLRSSRARKEAFDTWSIDRANLLKEQRALEQKRDPRITYLEFLAKNASTKLYWPEFKRKFRREAEMNDRSLQDRDREKLYRELVTKLKMPEAKRNEELKALLKGISAGSQLPTKTLTSVVLYSVSPDVRNTALQPFSVA